MSCRRALATSGWVDPARLPRGPNGRALCRRCHQEVPAGRRTFCGPACVHEWKVRSNPGYARRQVEKRDRGVCQICRLDTRGIEDLLDRLRSRWKRGRPLLLAAVIQVLRLRGFRMQGGPGCGWFQWSHLWEMDHIVPVVEGGGECGLENLRTLCVPCHRHVTTELRGRLKSKGSRQLRLC